MSMQDPAPAARGTALEARPLLDIRHLSVSFATPRGTLHAVDDISFMLGEREALGIVGESGSGKSVTTLALLRLFGPLVRVRVSGQVLFDGRDLLVLPEQELRAVRGAQISLVFQDPLGALNPVLPVGEQIAESLRYHKGLSRLAATRRATELLDLVGIPDPHRRIDDLPHRFSGGMRQRIMIAIAIACEPRLLIADEPTSAVDVTVQAQVLLLLDRLRRDLGMSLITISHDLSVIAAICDRVQVMYGGWIVERGTTVEILERADHPYTIALMGLVPGLEDARGQRLRPISGQPTPVIGQARGCRFASRCEFATDQCREHRPPEVSLAPGHVSLCWLPATDDPLHRRTQ